jgi:hypothetical protein
MFVAMKIAALTLVVAGVMGSNTEENEEPHLAIRTGLKCSQCHVNRTGGGARTEFGGVYGQTQLPAVTEGFQFQNRALNDFVSIGANVRVRGNAFVTDADPRTSLDIQKADVMIEARLIRRVLALYIDESVGPGQATARELFGIVEGLPLNGYAKAGKFFLPYGLRLVDDREFIRDVTGFNMNTPDQGVEVGIEPGPLSVFLAVTNGTGGAAEGDDSKQVTGSAALVTRRFRIGGSASHNQTGTMTRDVVGGFGGVNLGPVNLLGEFDYILGSDAGGAELDQFVAFGEGNLWLAKGVNAKVAYGYHDRNMDVPEDQRTRMRLGLEVFPIPFLQASGYFTIFDDIPQAPGQQDQASLELHFFF